MSRALRDTVCRIGRAVARGVGSIVRRFAAANRALCRACERRFPRFFGFPSYQSELRRRVAAKLAQSAREVLEIGGIDRPFLAKAAGFHYVGMDIEDKPRCHEVYDRFVVQSVEQPIDGAYDLVLSITLLEHVADNDASIASIFGALRPGGETHHYVPGKGHPYALALRLVGSGWQKRLIGLLRRDEDARVSGYPAYFHRCTVVAMMRLFEDAGFEDVHATSYYRANDYFAFLFPAFVAITAFENLCRRFGWSYFASGFVISGRRPK
ncbi:MAG TPA: methyltransferase domain-containing protein [Myxococcota bacterium]|nr:methyltransferase domain-containing protein [Myxococcota bacterium]